MSILETFKKILPEELNRKAEDRLNICNSCENYNKDTKRCKVCGCFMEVKVYLPEVTCPVKKW